MAKSLIQKSPAITVPAIKKQLNFLKEVLNDDAIFQKVGQSIPPKPVAGINFQHLVRQSDADEATQRKVAFAFELASLTDDNYPLASALLNKTKARTLGDLALTMDKNGWAKILTDATWIPGDIPGDTVKERKEQYSAQLQNKLFKAAPQASIQGILKSGAIPLAEAPVRDALTWFLAERPDFDLANAPLDWMAEVPGALKDIPETLQPKALKVLGDLKESLEKSPDAEDFPTVFQMQYNGLTADQVLALSEDDFLHDYKHTLGLESAGRMHDYVVKSAVQKNTSAAQQQMLETIAHVLSDAKTAKSVNRAFVLAKGDWSVAFTTLSTDIEDETKLRRVQFAHGLADLTDSNKPLAVNLFNKQPKIQSLRDVALQMDKKAWLGTIDAKWIPETIKGESPQERKKQYAGILIDRLYHRETSATLQRMTSSNVPGEKLPIKKAGVRKGLDQFFKNQPDFNIRTTSVYKAFKQKDAFKGISPEYIGEVMTHAKLLQRVQAISPTTEALPVLMETNITSALRIAEMPESVFLKAFGEKLSEATAKHIYKNAVDIQIRNEYALASIREAVKGTGVSMIDDAIGADIQQMKTYIADKLSDQINWENLFEGLDSCEYDECQTVYSPAAYFVELLQYLRNNNLDDSKNPDGSPKYPNTGQKGYENTPLAKLLDRRPDLADLQLTCENTNTLIPYIDLVNEVMESYVAYLNGKQKDSITPHNVTNEDSSELLAQPQHTNIEAYRILHTAKYPFTLPYHQPLDTIRTYLEHLKTSRYELMEIFGHYKSVKSAAEETLPKKIRPGVFKYTIADIAKLPKEKNDRAEVLVTVIARQRALDAEYLGLTEEEYTIITKKAFLTKEFFDLTVKEKLSDKDYGILDGRIPKNEVGQYYGYKNDLEILDTNEENGLGLTFVKKQFLKRAGVTISDLVAILKTEYINPKLAKAHDSIFLPYLTAEYSGIKRIFEGIDEKSENKRNSLVDALKKSHSLDNAEIDVVQLSDWLINNFESLESQIVLKNQSEVYLPVSGILFANDGSNWLKFGTLHKNGNISDDQNKIIAKINFESVLVDPDGIPMEIPFYLLVVNIYDGIVAKFIGNVLSDNDGNRIAWQAPEGYNELIDLRLQHLNGDNLNITEYDRIHRFIRLWRKLGWTMDELDQAIIGLSKSDKSTKPDIDPALIHQLVAVKKLHEKTRLPILKLLPLWTNISTRGENALYRKMFLSRTIPGKVTAFQPDASGNYLPEPDEFKLTDQIPTLMSAFKARETEIRAVINNRIPSDDDKLSLENVSTLYRDTTLAKLLGVHVDKLPDVQAIFGNPYDNPDGTLTFLENWERLKAAGLKFQTLNYLLKDKDDPQKPLRPRQERLIRLAQTLVEGINAIEAAHPDISSPEQVSADLIRQKAGLLLEQSVVEEIIKLLEGTKVFTIFLEKKPELKDGEKSDKKLHYDAEWGILHVTRPLSRTEIKNFADLSKMSEWKDAVNRISDKEEKYTTTLPGLQFEPELTSIIEQKQKYDKETGKLEITGTLSSAEAQYYKTLSDDMEWHQAIDTIYQMPKKFVMEHLSGIFPTDPTENNNIRNLLRRDYSIPTNVQEPEGSIKASAFRKSKIFLDGFLPFLRQRLVHRFLVEALSTEMGLVPDVTELLISDVLKTAGHPIETVFTALKTENISAYADNLWRGYFIPAISDRYTFISANGNKPVSFSINGETLAFPTFDNLSGEYIYSPVDLKQGEAYRVEIKYAKDLSADLKELTWKSATMSKSPLPATMLYPAYALEGLEAACFHLQKAALLVNAFELKAEEIEFWTKYFARFAEKDKINFNAPTLSACLRLQAHTQFRNSLPEKGVQLIPFFKWAMLSAIAAEAPKKDVQEKQDLTAELLDQIEKFTRWPKEKIDSLIAAGYFNIAHPKYFFTETHLLRLQKAMRILDRIGMEPDALFRWADFSSDFDTTWGIAEDIQKTVGALYETEDWKQAVKPLNDRLRNHQKQALIDYLLTRPELMEANIFDADGLFEFFLIDVQMEPCMQTSRIKQAISSTQLFIQRCFLGLEKDQKLDRERWDKWMQRYRVWEANRKVFLYPENWIEPNLRDEKSPFFKELESELLQKDINQQTVTDALKNYLYKVDEVANMQVVGLFIEGKKTNNKWNAGSKLYVFSRTQNAPHFYYFRYLALDEGNWYPWEKIQLDIPIYNVEDTNGVTEDNGTYLIPVIWNNRILVFFPQFMKKTEPSKNISINTNKKIEKRKSKEWKKVNKGTDEEPYIIDEEVEIEQEVETGTEVPLPESPNEYWEIKIAWSEYRNKKWTQKQICIDAFISNYFPINGFKFIPFIKKDTLFICVRHNNDKSENFICKFNFSNNNIYLYDLSKEETIKDSTYLMFFHRYLEIVNKKLCNVIESWQHNWIEESGKYEKINERIIFRENDEGTIIFGLPNGKNYYTKYIYDLLCKINLEKINIFFQHNVQVIEGDDVYGRYHDNDKISYHELKRPYSSYYWELFFHKPIMLADHLSKNQQFEEAMQWFHYVFNPLEKGENISQVWQFYPFGQTKEKDFLDTLFNGLQAGKAHEKITEWRNKPFMPHVIARSRPSAYMKWVVMRYIDNLIAWGDHLFRQDTIESINQATQLYIMAGHILGPRPQKIPKRTKTTPKTYDALKDKWDAFSNAIVEMEVLFPFSSDTAAPGASEKAASGLPNVYGFAHGLYFAIPDNPQLLGYWDTVADRLFKIRHCQNIQGVFRSLALFEPPIDPALLVQAAAQGLSLSSVLNDLNAPMPNYRFFYLVNKALELCNELKSLGNALLSALEKKDAEQISAMRAQHESSLHNLVMEVRKQQLEEANKSLESLQHSRKSPEHRMKYYLQLIGDELEKIPGADVEFSELANAIEKPVSESGLKLSKYENEDISKASAASELQTGIGVIEMLGSYLSLIPQISADGKPLGVGVGTSFGGDQLSRVSNFMSKYLQIFASNLSYQSSHAAKKGGFQRALQERILQANSAGYEIKQIDKQITAQQIRISIAEQEITNQQKQIDNVQEVEEFLKNKYTNEELYTWMEGSIKTLYHQAYALAYDLAKRAEKVYRFERGLTSSNFIQFGYWDSARNGLLSGERLYIGLKQLESAYQENRGHDYEISKYISLRQINPMALLAFRAQGKCEFDLPEVLFDMDFPGHYKRRIKSVSVSIPCVAGPYTTVNCTALLLNNRVRISPIAVDYATPKEGDDNPFLEMSVPITAIAVSSGQDDSGMFELNFKDERFMPFEGAGVISKWRLELPGAGEAADSFRQFDYDTISDVIIHIRYTALEGGDGLKAAAKGAVNNFVKPTEELSQEEGLFAIFDLKNDFPTEWQKAFSNPSGDGIMTLNNLKDRLPFFTKGKTIVATDVYLLSNKELGSATIAPTLVLKSSVLKDGLYVMSLSELEISVTDWEITIGPKEGSELRDMKIWLVVRYKQ